MMLHEKVLPRRTLQLRIGGTLSTLRVQGLGIKQQGSKCDAMDCRADDHARQALC